MKVELSLFFTCTFTVQAVLGQNAKGSGLDSMGIYQETCMRSLIGPDLIENRRLFQNLREMYVYNSVDANELNIDSTALKQRLAKLGIKCVDRKFALANELPWIDFETRPNHDSGKTHNCVLTISDVVKLDRQPANKYRLKWWSKHLSETSPQKGFEKLTDLLIEDLIKSRTLLKSSAQRSISMLRIAKLKRNLRGRPYG